MLNEELNVNELFEIEELPELAGSGDSMQVGMFIGVGIDLIIGK